MKNVRQIIETLIGYEMEETPIVSLVHDDGTETRMSINHIGTVGGQLFFDVDEVEAGK